MMTSSCLTCHIHSIDMWSSMVSTLRLDSHVTPSDYDTHRDVVLAFEILTVTEELTKGTRDLSRLNQL